jgi:Spy/CpxP family protein refolding chaperone
MNTSKIALLSAFWLITGVSALSGASFAADAPPPKKPSGSQPIARPDAPGMMCDHEGGMMGGHGPGMMGGGPGMMGGYGAGMMGEHGSGMMMGSPRMGLVMSLDLNDDQRSKINKLSDELKHDNWATKGLIMDESAKLRDLYAADKRDPAAIGKEYQKIFDLQRRMIEATITTQNRIEELLTPDQRAQLKQMHRKRMPMHDYPMR